MQCVKTKKVEGCLEGTNVYDILLTDTITKEFIDYIGSLGKLIYYAEIEKPFFKVIVRGKYTVKGSQGNKSVRVLLPEGTKVEALDDLIEYIDRY